MQAKGYVFAVLALTIVASVLTYAMMWVIQSL